MKKAAAKTQAVETPLIAYKGMNEQMRCRDFQHEIGMTYTHEGKIVRCVAGGFHAKNPKDDVAAMNGTCQAATEGKLWWTLEQPNNAAPVNMELPV